MPRSKATASRNPRQLLIILLPKQIDQRSHWLRPRRAPASGSRAASIRIGRSAGRPTADGPAMISEARGLPETRVHPTCFRDRVETVCRKHARRDRTCRRRRRPMSMRFRRQAHTRRCRASSPASIRRRTSHRRHGRRTHWEASTPPARWVHLRSSRARGAADRSESVPVPPHAPRIPIRLRSAGGTPRRFVATATSRTPARPSSSRESRGGFRSARIRACASSCGTPFSEASPAGATTRSVGLCHPDPGSHPNSPCGPRSARTRSGSRRRRPPPAGMRSSLDEAGRRRRGLPRRTPRSEAGRSRRDSAAAGGTRWRAMMKEPGGTTTSSGTPFPSRNLCPVASADPERRPVTFAGAAAGSRRSLGKRRTGLGPCASAATHSGR